MESNLLKSEISDTEYISGLSTVLATTIEEAKDRISEAQHIFCSQLFPKFQALNKIYADAKEAEERKHKEKEKDLLFQITKIESEKQQVTEENLQLKLEKLILRKMKHQLSNRLKDIKEELEKQSTEISEGREMHLKLHELLKSKSSQVHTYENRIQELSDKNLMLQKNHKSLEVETESLRLNLTRKTKEVAELMELKNKLLCINQSDASLIEQKDMRLREYEDKPIGLNSRVEKMEKKIDELQLALREKTEEVGKANEAQGILMKKVEYQATDIMDKQELLHKYEKKNVLLAAKIDELVNRVNELENVKCVQEQLHKEIGSFDSGKMKRGHEFDNYEKEKKQLLDEQKSLEDKVDKLQQSLHKRSKESYQAIELHGALLKQIEAKNSEVQSEKNKRRKIVASYKSLKCQYDVMRRKYGHTPEAMVHDDKKEDQRKVIKIHPENQSLESICATKATCFEIEVIETKDQQELLQENKVVQGPKSCPVSPSMSSILIQPKCRPSIKSWPPAGAKRPISYWRNTRSHQNCVGPDPHDDFFDTPPEDMGGNVRKVKKTETHDRPKPVLEDMNDDLVETRDINVDPEPEKENMSTTKSGPSGFKYVEPVRKRSEREGLKGVECKQCKKFYDVVLAEGGKISDGSKQNVRCEHHEGVSRHRYRYAPPLTPEGFWNIGFESET